jgi:hypothetical protein
MQVKNGVVREPACLNPVVEGTRLGIWRLLGAAKMLQAIDFPEKALDPVISGSRW